MGTKMYFIQEGVVDIVDTDGRVATSLSDGSYFGGEPTFLLINKKCDLTGLAFLPLFIYSTDIIYHRN